MDLPTVTLFDFVFCDFYSSHLVFLVWRIIIFTIKYEKIFPAKININI
jgi:hypothetical protein